MDHVEKLKRKLHPEQTANIVSVLSFFYTLKLFRKGFKKDLEEDDLYEVLPSLSSKAAGDQLEAEWEKQKAVKKLSMVRLLWACYGWKYLIIGVVQLIVNSIIIFLQPHAQGKLIAYFVTGQTQLTTYDAYYYASLLIILNIVNTIYSHNYYLIVTALGIRMRTAFSSFIYRKTLKLSPSRLEEISVGKVVTHITRDVQSLESFVHFANSIWIGIFKCIIICYIIYNKIGLAAVTGVGFLFLLMPVQVYFGTLVARLRMKMCKRSDERLQVTQEMLSAIRIIKMYTWEKFFTNKAMTARKKEIKSMHNIFYSRFIVLTIGSLNAKLAFYILLMTHVWLGNNLTAEVVYFIQSCFQILSFTISVLFPIGIGQTGELFSSMKRIGNVLKALELQSPESTTGRTIKPRIIIKNVDVRIKDLTVLYDINLNIEMGLTLIAGPVGSGKSFLLKTILQDYEPSSGNVEIQGKMSYASQEPWLFPSSIKQNILFGEAFNEERYQQVLTVCALRYDFDLLASGDATIVEDRGMNLSKGQQARVNLARAVYKDADIYLLDDCLSALDAHVSDFIFNECIMKFLRNKLVVLVTHNTKHVKDVDTVVIMKKGTIKSVAKSTEIIENEINLGDNKKFVESEDEDVQEDDTNEESKLITETTTERKIYHEKKQEGVVAMAVYKKYIKFGGGIFVFCCVFSIFVVGQFFHSYADKLVSKWVNLEQILSNYTTNNFTESEHYEETVAKRNFTLHLYTFAIVGSAVFSLSRSFALFVFARKASIRLHKYMVTHVVNATMYFFDTNFIGNILNRFSKDLATIDESIPFVLYHLFLTFLYQAGIIILIATVNVTFLIPTAMFFILLTLMRRAYIPTGRSLKRLDASTRSPVVGHLNATLEGLTTIRAFKAENILRDEYDKHQDLYTSATYTFQCSMRAFGFYMDALCTFFITGIILRFLLANEETEAGNVGLAISQAFLMIGSLQWAIRQWAEIENQMTSVERVLEYTEVKQESIQGSETNSWPKSGEVQYQNVSLTYTNSPEKVLKNISFIVKPQEKIGIVGRTGAGKSSIISTLFRLYEVEGKITVDGVDTKTLSLKQLRSKISIIPQDPVLFTGTIRDNIDPIGQYSDEEIWKAIETANLKKLVPALDFEIKENGTNFSIGQRQLICLARAVIRNNKIIVLDEATANMDHETDILIHETIQRNLASCTVFTIAHKLQSILHSDKVMVLDKGEIIEFDEPKNLLENKNGNFYKMVKKAGLLSAQA